MSFCFQLQKKGGLRAARRIAPGGLFLRLSTVLGLNQLIQIDSFSADGPLRSSGASTKSSGGMGVDAPAADDPIGGEHPGAPSSGGAPEGTADG